MFDGGAELAKLSLQVGTGAALTLSALGAPGAWPFVAKMYVHQYSPDAFWEGAEVWSGVAADVRAARERIGDLVAGVSGNGWRSQDGRAFQRRMDAFLDELLSIEIRASLVAAVLYMSAVALAAMIMFVWLVAAAMAAIAAWVLLAAVSPLSVASARILALNVLMKMFSGFEAVESGLDTLLHTCAGLLGATIAGDVFVEAVNGDHSAVTDFAQATVSQGPLLIWGTANRAERDLTAHGIDGRFPGGGFWGDRAGSRAGLPLPPGLTQFAGVKGVSDVSGGRQTVTGPHVPEQDPDGSYDYPWE
ncbi:hypothetical protein [Streptosporangium roseum]|uniref:Uncharacterized protein n=1 Tax=Streptosporangium roseum (strain ATCC 12428 / DSM 43021 / JCM 3005 / KCTC 9067 / NCIMB 10171 / NRRL 2505 / NI 9100) TaxID=479432 RepID=D2B2J4_STRRD|nr:hypothetical protein [Streptosporangium roseum]ACZ83471.1 hypothetical protein Sros_0444 [Streptosporangium roseum DSM 43021]